MGFREHRAKAAAAIHGALADAAFLLRGIEAPVAVQVRVHAKGEDIGDLVGGGLAGKAFVTLADNKIRLIFHAPATAPQRDDLVWMTASEIYRLESRDDPDGPTVSWQVVRLTAVQAALVPDPTS